MLVKEIGQENPVEVYIIYWEDEKIHYMGIPYSGYEGLNILIDDEIDVLDNSIDNFVLIKNDNGNNLFIHRAASNGDLIDSLIDHEADAVDEFRRRLAEYK